MEHSPIPLDHDQSANIQKENCGNSEEHEVPDMLKAWELDPHFHNRTRAIPIADYVTIPTFGISEIGDGLDTSPTYNNAFVVNDLNHKLENFTFRDSTNTVEFFDLTPRSRSVSACPERPSYLKQTHLRMRIGGTGDHSQNDVDTIIRIISHCLDSFHEFDFSFIPATMTWKGKYLQGVSQCSIRIHLYCELPSISPSLVLNEPTSIQYIIETYRIQGDARPFYDFFKEFKNMIIAFGGCAASRESSMGNFTLTSCEDTPSPYNHTDFVSEEEANSRGLTTSVSQPVFSHCHINGAPAPPVHCHGASMASYPPQQSSLTSSTSAPLLHANSSNGNSKNCCGTNLRVQTTSPDPKNDCCHQNTVNTGTNMVDSLMSPCASQFIPNVPGPSSCTVTCPEAYLSILMPILNMAHSQLYESQLEAAKMLWDISVQSQSQSPPQQTPLMSSSSTSPTDSASLTQHLRHQEQPCCIFKISEALQHLIVHTTFHTVREQAIVTLARFMELSGYVQSFVHNGDVMRVLQAYICDPENEEKAYDSAQLRRECAFILAELVACDANTVLRHLQRNFPETEATQNALSSDSTSSSLHPGGTSQDILSCLHAYDAAKPMASCNPQHESNTHKNNYQEHHTFAAWLASLEHLKDVRLRTQALRIRDGLMRALQRNSQNHF